MAAVRLCVGWLVQCGVSELKVIFFFFFTSRLCVCACETLCVYVSISVFAVHESTQDLDSICTLTAQINVFFFSLALH